MAGNTFLLKDVLGERCASLLAPINLHHKPPKGGVLLLLYSWSFLSSLGTVPASQEGHGMLHWPWHRALAGQPAVTAPRAPMLRPDSVKVLALPFLSAVWERHEN